MIKADLTQREVDAPNNNWCASGHCAPLLFRREGQESTEQPTRFFRVTGNDINGTYCEICLIIAHWVSKQSKK